MKITKKSKNQVIIMWFQNDIQIKKFIIDIVFIIVNDYEKFFNKFKKKSLNIK